MGISTKHFSLATTQRGQSHASLCARFFPPDQDLCVELTTLRPQLSIVKNRKLRLMHKLNSHINIKLFKPREMHDLLVIYGHDHEAARVRGTEAGHSC
jgi:hypothetical protein